jgi:hypothetical protein
MGMGLDEETFQTVDKAKVDITVNMLIVVRDPKIAIGFLQTPDVIEAHAVIFRQNDFNGVTSNLELVGKPLDYVSQTAHLGDRCALRCNHHNIHLLITSVSGDSQKTACSLVAGRFKAFASARPKAEIHTLDFYYYHWSRVKGMVEMTE